ncbi:MAG TPA: HD-GYP domain-containing protein [Candidatus Deferrimicrobiaceae bacterium]
MIAALTVIVTILHFRTTAGPHDLHWLHLFFQKLYYIPILLAAAWFGPRTTGATALAVTALFSLHIWINWAGDRMQQSDQIGEIASFWLLALLSSVLFERQRKAFEETKTAHQETLSALASSLDLREHDTGLHSRRVAEYTMLLAHRMGFRDERYLEELRKGAILHDIGKIGVPDRILLKESRLTDEEMDVIRHHPAQGAALIGEIPFLEGTRELVLSHHEKYDGTGYPRGLSGEAIPIGGRIFAVADVFDALTANRSYREPASWIEAADHIDKGSGTHFDPEVVNAFLAIPFRDLEEIAARTGVDLRQPFRDNDSAMPSSIPSATTSLREGRGDIRRS